MYQAVIIADDFSSAADCGVQFVRHGVSAKALLDMEGSCFPKAQVLSVDTDSRAVSSKEAYIRNQKTAKNLKSYGFHRIYKSIDSTLRGNIGAEIDGILDGLGWTFALAAPGFPLYGRVIVDGLHYLDGTLLAESFLQNDPVCPIKESSFLKILDSQLEGRAACIGLDTLRAGKNRFLEEVQRLRKNGITAAAVDTQTESDLKRIARYSRDLKECLLCGSTGLARYLPQAWNMVSDRKEEEEEKAEGPVIVAAASQSPVTQRQIQVLDETGWCTVVKIPPQHLAEKRWGPYFDTALDILEKNRDLVLCVEVQEKKQVGNLEQTVLAGKTTEQMGLFVKRLLEHTGAAGIVMTGGDTARGICRSLNGTAMELKGEIEPGIPKGELEGSFKIPIVTKAGAFGTENVLVRAVKELGGEGKWRK